MSDIQKTLSDFSNGLDLGQFDSEVAADADVVAGAANFGGVTHQGATGAVLIHFDIEPGQAAKDAIDTLIANHVPS